MEELKKSNKIKQLKRAEKEKINKAEQEDIKKRKRYTGLYFVLPSLIGVAIFTLLPFLDVFIRSFQSAISREFIGFQNYVEVFNNAAFKLAATNTIKFVFICIPLLLTLSLILAVILNKFTEASKVLRTAFLIPMAVPIVSVVLIWNIVFNEYGATNMQCFTKITLPCLKPTLYTISVLSLLNSFKVFREAYLVAGNYPDKSMYLLQHLFNNWFRELSFDKMAAASILMAIVIFILIMLLQRAWEKQD